MIKTLLIIVVIWLNPTTPHEIMDHVVMVSEIDTLAECEIMRRETISAWSEPQIGLFAWSWCVEARAP